MPPTIFPVTAHHKVVNGRIWFARQQGSRWTAALWQQADAAISSFGEDDDGGLYVVDHAQGKPGLGNVRRIAAAR